MAEVITLNGLEEVERRLERIQNRRPLLDEIGQSLVSDYQLGFRQSVSPDGSRWLPLKIRKGQPLRDTGRLRNSIEYDADDDQVEVGTNIKYAKIHQFGGEVKPKKGQYLKFPGSNGRSVFVKKVVIPARPFLGIKPRQIRKINRALSAWAEKSLNG